MKQKVLVGFIMDGKGGGIDKYLLNFLENVWYKGLQIDLLTNEIDLDLQSYLKKYDARIFQISNLRHPISQYKQVKELILKEKYDIVYLNISTAIDCIAALAAHVCKVKRILLHSHSSGNDCETTWKRKLLDTIHYVCRTVFYRFGTEYYGCSEKAGEWMFPNKIVHSNQFTTIFNAVNLDEFKFDSKMREDVREEFCLEGKFVVGHVGNFCYQKNHDFLIQVFEEVYKRKKNAVLFLVGQGERYEHVKEIVYEKGLQDVIIFAGYRKDVFRLLQGMDFFLLPSHFEGLPTVGIEAQCCGLPCLMSDTITKETQIIEECYFLSYKEKPSMWAEFLLGHQKEEREKNHWIGSQKKYDLSYLKYLQNELILKSTSKEGAV